MTNPTISPNKPIEYFPRRFVFHGNAVAAAMIIRRTGTDRTYNPSPVHGQSSLPTIGGHSESFVASSDPAFAKTFSYGECRTQADGILTDDQATTTLSSSVRDVRVVNQPSQNDSSNAQPIEFRAGLVSLAMRSTHRHGSEAQIEFSAPPQYQGLIFDNLEVQVELRRNLMETTTMTDLEYKFLKDDQFFNECRDAFMWRDPTRPRRFGQRIPRMNGGYAVCSIVRRIRWGNEWHDGNVLTKKGFGSIYFGEMLVNDYNRRVTLVRFKLGSETELDGALVEGDPNGDWVPPEN